MSVVRITGENALGILEKLTKKELGHERTLVLRRLWSPIDGRLMDRGMVVYFRGPNSFTGEDVVELHVHGSRAVVDVLSENLIYLGLLPAEPGDFTKRAFENGKMDLTQIEGLSDLILSQTAAQQAQAVNQMEGGLKEYCDKWRASLVRLLGLVEAVIDFPDEDLPDDILEGIERAIGDIDISLREVLSGGEIGPAIREGLRIAVIGPPNVGKSSILNQLAKRDVAIVSEEAGTTRDVIEVPLNLAGVPVIFCDTAGLRDAPNKIEQEGVRRARLQAESADFRIWIEDATSVWPIDFSTFFSEFAQEDDFILLNKTDLISESVAKLRIKEKLGTVYAVSAKSGAGLDGFIKGMTESIARKYSVSEVPLVTRMRQKLVLEDFLGHVERLKEMHLEDVSMFAEDLRLGLRSLGELAGQVDVEEILDVIFKEFCIGK